MEFDDLIKNVKASLVKAASEGKKKGIAVGIKQAEEIFNKKIDEFKEDLDTIMFGYDWVINDKTSIFSKDYTEWGPKVEVSYWIKEYRYIDCGKVTILENINRLIDDYRKNSRRKIKVNVKK